MFAINRISLTWGVVKLWEWSTHRAQAYQSGVNTHDIT